MDRPLATPDRLVDTSGRVRVGWFEGPVPDPNLGEAPARHLLSALRGTPLSSIERRYRRWRLKEWLYVSAVSERAFFACAVVDAGYVGSAFAYVVDRRTGRKHEWSTLAPLARGIGVAPCGVRGTTAVDRPGFGRVAMTSDADGRSVEVALEAQGDAPPLVAHYRLDERSLAPVAVVEETQPGRWLYTHKCYGLPAHGSLEAGALAVEGPALAGLDYNRGFRPRETWWSWAAGAGRDRQGAVVGFNLTAHRPWDAPAGAEPDAADGGLWLDGERVKIRCADFEQDRGRRDGPWRIRDDRGLVDLRFEPAGERREEIDLAVVVSRFAQPYGRFEGTLRSPSGRVFAIDELFGVTEQHFARW